MRIRVNDFSAGQIDLVEADLIPNNALQEVRDMEYTVVGSLKRRKRPIEYSAISDITARYDVVLDFYIWYPSNNIDNAGISYCVIIYGQLVSSSDYTLRLYYYDDAGTPVLQTDVLSVINSNLLTTTLQSLSFTTSNDKLLIVSEALNVQSIYVDINGDIQNGEEGIPSPLSFSDVSPINSKNEFVEIDADFTGMTLYKGSILTYSYTHVNKLGVESNPSPITVFDDLAYIEFDSSTGEHKYYWSRTTLNQIKTVIAQSPAYSILKDDISYFKIYRTDSMYSEGTVAQLPMTEVAILDISSIDGDNLFIDIFPAGTNAVSYENDTACSGADSCNVGSINFVSSANSGMNFPHAFKHVMRIKLTNNNGKDYVNQQFRFEINDTDLIDEDSIQVFNWVDVTTAGILDNPDKFRIYAGDTITPLPTTYRLISSDRMQVSIRIPMASSGVNYVYLVYADAFDGDNSSYDTAAIACMYGEWIEAGNIDWKDNQATFKPNRPRNFDNFICASCEGNENNSWNINRANITQNGIIFGGNGSWSSDTVEEINVLGVLQETNFDDTPTLKFPLGITQGNITFSTVNKDLSKITASFFTKLTNGVAYQDIQFGTLSLRIQENAGDLDFIFSGTTIMTMPSTSVPAGDIPLYICLSYNTIDNVVSIYVHELSLDSIHDAYDVSVAISTPTGSIVFKQSDDGLGGFTETLYGQISVTQDRYINTLDDMLLMHSNYPSFVGIGSHIGYHESDAENKNILFDPMKSLINENKGNVIRWSDFGGNVYPDLNFKIMNEPVKRILTAPSFLQFEYQNTILIFTRNSVSRFVLEGTPDGWASSTTNIIKEQTQLGLLSNDSVFMTGDAVFWLSEIGVIKWDSNGIQNISKDIIDIDLDKVYYGLYIATKHQYWLHNETDSKTFVFDILKGSWVTFTGLSIRKSRIMSAGEQIKNINLFLNDDNKLDEYPTNVSSSIVTHIKTKKYPVNHEIIFRRFRIDFTPPHSGSITTSISIENKYSSAPTSIIAPSDRMIWAGLANGSFGENIELVLTNAEEFKKLEIDAHERS